MLKKVAHTSLYYFELSENWIHTQLKYLEDWDRIVLTNETKNLETLNDWQPRIYERRRELPLGIRELDSIAMKLIGYYPSFYRIIKRSGAKLIHAHFGPMGFLCLGIARKLEIPLVTTFYGYDASELPRENPYWQENYQMLFKEGTRFLVEGPAMGRKLEQLGCPPEKITVQHLGIELEDYPERKSYQPEKNISTLMVGRFVEKKGFLNGLQAFQKFLAQGGEGTLTLVGDDNGTAPSQKIEQQMQHFVQENGLEESVVFKGLIPLDELKKEYYKHDVFMAPSVEAANGDDEGGLPVTVIEAAASGMALIGSRHCDIPEVIQHAKTGFLAEEKNVEQLTNHLKTLAENPERRKKIGRAARSLVEDQYNAEKQGKKLAQIYDELI